MRIEERRIGNIVILTVDGDITMGEGGATRLADKVRSLLQRGHDRIVMDLRRVRYVDSAGLGEMVHCAAAVRTRHGALKLLNVNRKLNDLLILTKLLTVFDCFDSNDEAIASFNGGA
jgi:anti-sigma B factor antagonist